MKLSEIANIIGGQVIGRLKGGGIGEPRHIKVMSNKAINYGSILKHEISIEQVFDDVPYEKLTRQNDIVLKLSTPYDSVLIDEESEGYVVTSLSAIIRIKQDGGYDTGYVSAWLNGGEVLSYLKNLPSGTQIHILKLSDLANIEVPVIDIEKQKIIGQLWQNSIKQIALYKQAIATQQEIVSSILTKEAGEWKDN